MMLLRLAIGRLNDLLRAGYLAFLSRDWSVHLPSIQGTEYVTCNLVCKFCHVTHCLLNKYTVSKYFECLSDPDFEAANFRVGIIQIWYTIMLC